MDKPLLNLLGKKERRQDQWCPYRFPDAEHLRKHHEQVYAIEFNTLNEMDKVL